jgi:hypothetical protein
MPDEPDQEPDLELTSALVPFFVITKGRALPAEQHFDRTALVTRSQQPSSETRTMAPEARAVMDLVAHGFLSVAEGAGHTRLPLGVVRVLLAQMESAGLILVRKPVPRADQHDRELVSAVLDGLRTKFGA